MTNMLNNLNFMPTQDQSCEIKNKTLKIIDTHIYSTLLDRNLYMHYLILKKLHVNTINILLFTVSLFQLVGKFHKDRDFLDCPIH